MKFGMAFTLGLGLIFSISNLASASSSFKDLRCVSNRGHESEFLFKITDAATPGTDMYLVISYEVLSAEVKFTSTDSGSSLIVTGSEDKPSQSYGKLNYTLTVNDIAKSQATNVPAHGSLMFSYIPTESAHDVNQFVNPLECCQGSYPILNSAGNPYCEADKSKARAALLKELKEIQTTPLRPEALEELQKF